MYLSCLVIPVKCICYCQLLCVCHCYCQLLCVCRFVKYYVCVACNLHNGLILLRLIKCRQGRSACVWGRMLWCLWATCSPAPPFLLIISCGCYGSHINYFCPITVRALAHANGSPHGRHLHWPWLRTGTSIPGALPRMRMAPLYKRACLPSPWLTFWLNVT